MEIEEAALVDGCTPFQTLRRVIIPLAAPGVFTCSILVFIYAWNEFLFALTLNTRDSMRTVTVGITMFPGLYEIPWGTIFAASTLVTIPLIVLVLIFQRKIIAGLTAGAVKG
jgi:multiple sugar transport system permease protein